MEEKMAIPIRGNTLFLRHPGAHRIPVFQTIKKASRRRLKRRRVAPWGVRG